jgi:hypothetical protein
MTPQKVWIRPYTANIVAGCRVTTHWQVTERDDNGKWVRDQVVYGGWDDAELVASQWREELGLEPYSAPAKMVDVTWD